MNVPCEESDYQDNSDDDTECEMSENGTLVIWMGMAKDMGINNRSSRRRQETKEFPKMIQIIKKKRRWTNKALEDFLERLREQPAKKMNDHKWIMFSECMKNKGTEKSNDYSRKGVLTI